MRKFLLVLMMFVCGGASMVAFDALLRLRHEQAPLWSTRISDAGTPGELVRNALRESLLHAAAALRNGARADAVMTLDAAERAADVAAHGLDARFEQTLDHVRKTRHALHDGNREQALARIDRAVAQLREMRDVALPQMVLASHAPRYRGAVVLDVRGNRIGELVEIRQQHGTDAVVLQLGATRDVFGLAGRRSESHLAPPSLIYGQTRTLGTTMVIVGKPALVSQ